MIPNSNLSPRQFWLCPTLAALAALTCLLVGCAPGAPETLALSVVTTNTILADLVSNVGSELVSVTSLVPAGADVHTFQTTPSNSIIIGAANLIISNGAGLDNFLDPVLKSAQRPGTVHIIVSKGLEATEIEKSAFPREDAGPMEHTQGYEYSEGDPHFWLDPTLTIHYVERILEGLTRADPNNARRYTANSQAYIEQLRQLDQEIAQTLSRVPPEHRHLVTFHDAYGYFARRYEWKISAFASSDSSDVTPGDIATIMEQIKRDGIPAVFAEPQLNSDVLRQTAQDAGVEVGIIRSLVDDQALTYIDMMRTNAGSLAENLG